MWTNLLRDFGFPWETRFARPAESCWGTHCYDGLSCGMITLLLFLMAIFAFCVESENTISMRQSSMVGMGPQKHVLWKLAVFIVPQYYFSPLHLQYLSNKFGAELLRILSFIFSELCFYLFLPILLFPFLIYLYLIILHDAVCSVLNAFYAMPANFGWATNARCWLFSSNRESPCATSILVMEYANSAQIVNLTILWDLHMGFLHPLLLSLLFDIY